MVVSTLDSALWIMPIQDSFSLRFYPLGNLSKKASAYFGFCRPWSLFTWILSIWKCVHLKYCQLWIVRRLVLSNLDCALFCFCLLRSLFTWDFVFFDSVHSRVRPNDNLLTKDYVQSWFGPIWIVLTFGFSCLGVSPPGCSPTWILSFWESGQMTFCPRRIVSTIGSANSRFCSRFALST